MDAVIYPYELASVFDDVARDLQASGRGEKCACCGKPFNNKSRKPYGLARATFGSPMGLLSWSYPLCRKCTKAAKRNGGHVPENLKRQAYEEAALLVATPGGAA